MPNANPKKTAFRAKVKIGSVDIPFDDMIDLSISSELNLPDAFALTLGSSPRVKKEILPNLKLQDRIEAHLNYQLDEPDYAFIGELTRVEPISSERASQGGFTVLRGYNAMHGLARGKRSFTYLNQTDKEIVDKVLQRNSALKLSADFGKEPPKIKYEHVYQSNKSDLQFILDRAKRTGYFVLVRDDKLLYQKRDPTPSPLKLKLVTARKQGDDANVISLEDFVPRLSTAHQVTEVIVRAWDPKKRKEIIGKAPKSGAGKGGAQLGSKTGADAVQERYPDSVRVMAGNISVSSQDEAEEVAAAILDECLLSYVQADGSVPGDPRLKPGMVVTIETGNKQFDGKYFLTRVRHRYRTGDRHPFTTDFYASRDAVEEPDPNAKPLGK